jgi:hypothetical protein
MTGRIILAAAVVCGVPSIAAAQLPSSFQTPGKAAKVNEGQVCSADFPASARPAAKWQRDEALTRYGKRPEDFTGELDLLIPSSLGGTTDPDNLWPQPANGELNTEAKNKLEDRLHEMVCSEKKLTLKQAQDAIKKDWVKAYKQYVEGQAAAK